METATLYKLIILGIALAAFFFHDSNRFRHRIRWSLYTATALMTVLFFNQYGFFSMFHPAICLGGGIGLAWVVHTGVPSLLKRYAPKWYWGKLR